MNASLPEELLYRAVWSLPPGTPEETLKVVCRRDFGLEGAAADIALEGWQLLSKAWDSFPYSAMTCGERAGYMRGPFYLGPAHPLIFDVQSNYGLPAEFFAVRGDASEIAEAEDLEEMVRRNTPRYVSDLLVTLPFSVDRYLELLAECRSRWERGLTALRGVLQESCERAHMELDVCTTISIHLRTLENVVRFYETRDRIQSSQMTRSIFCDGIDSLRSIAEEEIANAECALSILDRDPRIGYGHCYGPAYGADMVRSKLEQCRFVKDQELPRLRQVICFHIWNEW